MHPDEEDPDVARRNALSPILSTTETMPLAATVHVECGACSHAGKVRDVNQDHYLVMRLARSQTTLATSLPRRDIPEDYNEFGYAMLLADGLGEQGPGAVASRVAISTLAHLLLHFGKWNLRVDAAVAAEMLDRVEWFYRRVDEAVTNRGRSDPALDRMTTTLTAVWSFGDELFLAHVGHSRIYLYRDGSLSQLTRDHTVERRLVERPRPTPIRPVAQDLSHILTDTIGGGTSSNPVDVERFRLRSGDQILMCTDGLTNLVSEDRIADILALRRASDEQCRTLVDLALNAGGTDDVTVLLAQYEIPSA